VRLGALKSLATGEAEAGGGEDRDRTFVSGCGKLREGARKQVVAGRPCGFGAVARPGGGSAAAVAGTVDQIVVDQGCHVHELDGDAGRVRRLPVGGRGEKDEQRPEALPTGGKGFSTDRRGKAGMLRDALLQAALDLVEVTVEAVRLTNRRQCAHVAAVPV